MQGGALPGRRGVAFGQKPASQASLSEHQEIFSPDFDEKSVLFPECG